MATSPVSHFTLKYLFQNINFTFQFFSFFCSFYNFHEIDKWKEEKQREK